MDLRVQTDIVEGEKCVFVVRGAVELEEFSWITVNGLPVCIDEIVPGKLSELDLATRFDLDCETHEQVAEKFGIGLNCDVQVVYGRCMHQEAYDIFTGGLVDADRFRDMQGPKDRFKPFRDSTSRGNKRE